MLCGKFARLLRWLGQQFIHEHEYGTQHLTTSLRDALLAFELLSGFS